MDKYTYTTEHVDTHVLVKVYNKKTRKLVHKFTVEDFGDWNEVEYSIQTVIDNLD